MNKGFLALVIAAFFYSLQGVFSRLIGTDFGVFYAISIRNALILIILLAYVLLANTWKSIKKTDYIWFSLMSIPGILAFIFIFTAFNHLPIGTSLFLQYSSIISGGFILGYFLFNEKFTKIKIISLFFSLIGLYLIFSVSINPKNLIYMILAILSGFCASAWVVFSKKISSAYPLSQILTIDALISSFFCLILFYLFKEPVFLPSLSTPWFALLGLTIVTLGAVPLNVIGFRKLQAQIASLVLLTEVVFATIFGWVIFQQNLSYVSSLGGILIITGAALPNIPNITTVGRPSKGRK